MTQMLLLASTDGTHGHRSGYTALAGYLPEAQLLHTQRRNPPNLAAKVALKLARKLAFTNWYGVGSYDLEQQAKAALERTPKPVHMMWADRDLGFLHYFLRKRGIPLCATFHSCPDTFAENIQGQRHLHHFAAILLMASNQKEFFLRHGVSPAKIHVVLHGVNTAFFTPGTATEPYTVLAVGSYRRNFALLRDVVQAVGPEAGIRFRVIAPQAHKHWFVGQPHVALESGLTDQQLADAYRTASCFLMTAEDATANNGVLEAMASGLPIVAEAIGGIPEYAPAKHSLLTQPLSVQQLRDALLRVKQEAGLRQEMGLASRERALELDWRKVAARTQQIYDSLG